MDNAFGILSAAVARRLLFIIVCLASLAMPAGAAVASSPKASRSVDAAGPAQIPDTPVYDQDGRRLRFYSDLVKGKTVAINFIFTTCTTICPLLAASFREVQQELGDRIGRDVQLISISVDPATDVPKRLNAFSARFNAGPGWTFITGDKPEIALLLEALGASPGDKNNHLPMVLVGNESAAYWTRTYGLATADVLAKVIADASAKTAEGSTQAPWSRGAIAGETEAQKKTGVETHAHAKGASPGGVEVKTAKTPAEAAALYFPNTMLVTQDNQSVRFFDDLLSGKVVVIDFMFTTCTEICPVTTANLLQVQEYLGERVGSGVNMISITVDPTTDTPEALKQFASKYKVKPGWYFLTGKKSDVELVLRKVGGFISDKNDHTTLLMIGNVQTGQWMKIYAMTEPAEIADAVIRIAELN